MTNQYINRVNGIPIQDTELRKIVNDKISSAGTIDETDLDTILTDIYGFTDTTE